MMYLMSSFMDSPRSRKSVRVRARRREHLRALRVQRGIGRGQLHGLVEFLLGVGQCGHAAVRTGNARHAKRFHGVLGGDLVAHDADVFRKGVLECFNVSLGNGLGRLNGKVFRIGHLGDLNEPMLLGTLGAIEMGLELSEIPHRPEGVRAAMSNLVENNQ